ncbi:MAG: MarR family transcriptional regulator [Burkholderiaceae bacterium]
MTRCLQWRLAEHGVSFGHWMFLRILWEGDGLSQRALSEQAGLMESTTHSALVRMEQAGYIERRGLPGNRRRIHVFLTNSGRALEKKLVPLAEEVNAEALGGTSAQDIATTRRTLLSIVIRLAEDEQRALAAGRSIPANRALGNQPES